MYCTKCGTNLKDNTKFCTNCGEPVKTTIKTQSNTSYNYNTNNYQTTHENQYNYAYNYNGTNTSVKSDEDYIKAYVGPNYDKIKNSNFSIPTFFLGTYYFLYRKLWLYATIWIILIPILLVATKSAYTIINLIIVAIISINFKKIYLQHATKKVEQIKQQNMDKSSTELLELCKRKGGVSIAAPIIVGISIFVITFIVVFTAMFFFVTTKDIKDPAPKTTSPNNISELTYNMPKGFKFSEYSDDDLKMYDYYDNANSCAITIKTNSYTNLYKTIEEYINSSVYIKPTDKISNIENVNINNTTWGAVAIGRETYNQYIYATIVNNKIYNIEYTIYQDNSKECSKKLQELINSLKFETKTATNSI